MYIFMKLCHKMVFDYLLLPLYAILAGQGNEAKLNNAAIALC